MCIVNPFDLIFKSQKSKLSLENKNREKNHYGIKDFSQIHVGQLLVPLEILMSKIYLKYIYIYIHNYEHTSVIMNMELSSHGWLPVSQKYK